MLLCYRSVLFNGKSEAAMMLVPYTILEYLVLIIAIVFSRAEPPNTLTRKQMRIVAVGTRIMKLSVTIPCLYLDCFALLAYENCRDPN